MRYYDSLGAAGYPISGGISMQQSYQEHLDRGSAGVDFAVGIGRPIIAPTKGRVLNRSTSGGGNTARFYHVDENGVESGWYDEFLHLSSFGPDGAIFNPGEDIGARSGNTGTQTSGPHIHWHLCNAQGRRVPQWEQFREDPPKQKVGNDMYYNRVASNGWQYVVGQEYIRVITGEEVKHVAWNMGPYKEHSTLEDFILWCKALGVPESVVRALSPTNRNWSRLGTISGGTSGGATAEQIATAVDAALKDDFAAVPKAVNDDAAKRLKD